MRFLRLVGLCGAVAAATSYPLDAQACSAPWLCGTHRLRPATSATATLPANAGGVWYLPIFSPYPWTGTYSDDQTVGRSIELRLVQGTETTVLATQVADRSFSSTVLRFGVHTDATLPIGAMLILSANPKCASGDGGLGVPEDLGSYEIVAPVERPTTLGTLGVELLPDTQVPQPAGGACSLPATTASARLTVNLDAGAQAWLDAMTFETVVDGARWEPAVTEAPGAIYSDSQFEGGSFRGLGTDEVFAKCGAMANGVTEGQHVVQMRGVLPDGTVVATEEQTITLACPASTTKPDGGVSDASVPDAGVAGPTSLRGGGCSLGGGEERRAPFEWLALAASLVFVRRRRSS